MANKDSISSAAIDKLQSDLSTLENLKNDLSNAALALYSIRGLAIHTDEDTWQHNIEGVRALTQKAGALTDRCIKRLDAGGMMCGEAFEDWE